MDVHQVFDWAILRIRVIMNNLDKIEKVRIYNDLYSHRGNEYFRINFEVETNIVYKTTFNWGDKEVRPKLTKDEENDNRIWAYFNREKSYVHFDKQYYDDSYVKTNYEWIRSIFDDIFRIEERKFECTIERYISEKDREREKMKEKQEREKEKYFETYIPIAEPGDIVLLTEFRSDKLIEIDRNNVDIERPYSGYEIKKDLTKGKILVDWIRESDLFIVLTRSQLKDILELKAQISNKEKLIEELKSNYKNLKLKYIQD